MKNVITRSTFILIKPPHDYTYKRHGVMSCIRLMNNDIIIVVIIHQPAISWCLLRLYSLDCLSSDRSALANDNSLMWGSLRLTPIIVGHNN